MTKVDVYYICVKYILISIVVTLKYVLLIINIL